MFNCRAAAGYFGVLLVFGETARLRKKNLLQSWRSVPRANGVFPAAASASAPSASAEFSVIKDWLEIEIGGATLFSRGQKEWEADVLFKKPFTLSNTVELMVGAGPSWSYATGDAGKTGATFVLDFMFWPWPER